MRPKTIKQLLEPHIRRMGVNAVDRAMSGLGHTRPSNWLAGTHGMREPGIEALCKVLGITLRIGGIEFAERKDSIFEASAKRHGSERNFVTAAGLSWLRHGTLSRWRAGRATLADYQLDALAMALKLRITAATHDKNRSK